MAASRSRAPPLTSVLGPTRTTQLAAETFGVALDQVTAKLGDSALPDAPVEGGSFTTSSVGSAIHAACRSGQEELLRLAQKAAGSPLTGAELDDIVFADGGIRRKDGAEVSLAEAMPTGKVNRIEKQANAEPNESSQCALHPFGDLRRGQDRRAARVIRVTRVVNAVAAGRILNSKAAGRQF